MAVLVVYERDMRQVGAWPWIKAELSGAGSSPANLERVLVYDNSKNPNARDIVCKAGCDYFHDAHNGGTTAAYTRAVDIGLKAGSNWLLLLDQDTQLPATYLTAAAGAMTDSSAGRPSALVPWVIDGEEVVSPARITAFGSIRPLQRGEALHESRRLTAVASGALIRVSVLGKLLPFPQELWLDYVDHWMFSQLNLRGERIVPFDEVLSHELSITTPSQLSRRRLISILDGEWYFRASLGPLARLLYPLRMLARMARYALISPRLAGHMLKWMTRAGRSI
ncbi:MAG: hypothetical protein ACRD3E_19135 [Terriglobales bacterium]